MITRLLYVLHTPEYVATPTVTFAEDGLKPPGQFEFVYADSEERIGNESLFWSAVENRPVGDERRPFTESDAYSSDFKKDMPNLQYVSKVKLVQLKPYWRIMENPSRKFSEIHFPGCHTGRFTGKLIQFFRNFNSGVSHRTFYWKTHLFEFFD